MNITINAHDAAFSMRSFGAAPNHPPFVTLDANGPQYGISIFLNDEAAADELIKAACLAKDALHGQDHAAAMGPPCGDIATHTGRSCELAPGHEGWHRAGLITWPWAGAPLPDRGCYTAPSAAAVAEDLPHGAAADLAGTGLTYATLERPQANGLPGDRYDFGCTATYTTETGKHPCTLPPDHLGDHRAEGASPMVTWPDVRNTARQVPSEN